MHSTLSALPIVAAGGGIDALEWLYGWKIGTCLAG
jgi:hypothetical protein